MKILIKKDIPGYKAGEIAPVTKERTIESFGSVVYHFDFLIQNGFAEKIKEVDIEAIRIIKGGYTATGLEKYCTSSEIQWFNSYRIVKTFIEELNGEWKPDWKNDNETKYYVSYLHNISEFKSSSCFQYQQSIIPYCKDKETAKKVIELCQPELEVLFNIK